MARQAGLDLVEIAPNARPPVCKIIDYSKFKYEQKKKQNARKKKRKKLLKLLLSIEMFAKKNFKQ